MKFIYQFVVALTVLFMGSVLEPLFFPVVMNWTVTTSSLSEPAINGNRRYAMSGYMNKVRDCRFLSVQVTDNNHRQLPIKFLDNDIDDAANRPKGSQKWGFWTIALWDDSSEITVNARHQCHLMWVTETTLGKINVYTGLQ